MSPHCGTFFLWPAKVVGEKKSWLRKETVSVLANWRRSRGGLIDPHPPADASNAMTTYLRHSALSESVRRAFGGGVTIERWGLPMPCSSRRRPRMDTSSLTEVEVGHTSCMRLRVVRRPGFRSRLVTLPRSRRSRTCEVDMHARRGWLRLSGRILTTTYLLASVLASEVNVFSCSRHVENLVLHGATMYSTGH